MKGSSNGCVEEWIWIRIPPHNITSTADTKILVIDFDAAGKVCDVSESGPKDGATGETKGK